MTAEIWRAVSITLGALFVVSTVFMIYTVVKGKTMDELRAMAYRLILEAEHTYKAGGMGPFKMTYVVQHVRALLPEAVQSFVTEEAIQRVCQLWFDEVKDLLDDGKINDSTSE